MTASAMFAGAGFSSLQLFQNSGLPDQAITLDQSTATLIEKLHQTEVNELSSASDQPIVSQVSPDPVDAIAAPQHIIEPELASLQPAPVTHRRNQLSADKVMESTLQVSPEVNIAGLSTQNQASELELPASSSVNKDNASEVWRQRVVRFDEDLPGDIFLEEHRMHLLHSTAQRLSRVKKFVGFGNFNLVSFDEMLYHSKNQDQIGEFTREELDFLDEVFFRDASVLGFMGEKVVDQQTRQFAQNDVKKIPGSGHFLYRGPSENHFNQIKSVMGNDLVLTSGIRGIVKQYHLYLAKAIKTNGNLSRASRSLAPPGYSYHALGDFDVGQKGLGFSNFTSAFAESDVFKRLTDLGFIKIRYTQDNKFGVRFEPWHIRVV